MIKIIIVANFCNNIDNSRFFCLADLIANTKRYDVEVITSDFSHLTKLHKSPYSLPANSFKVTLCHEPGYVSHKGPKRLYSHHIWGKNVVKHIKASPKPDIIYCAIPSLTAAHDLALFCRKNSIKFVVDIQDLWPEAIFMLSKNRLVTKLARYMTRYVNVAYREADAIVAVSDTYVRRAKQVNTKASHTLSVYLGNDAQKFDSARNSWPNKNTSFTIGYIGTLSYSYDIDCVLHAIKAINDTKNYPHIKFLVMGDGPMRQHFEQQATLLDVDCEFTGMLPYEKMVGRLCKCDTLVNPIVKGSPASIINKVGDYALAGLPVVNSQECPEYQYLIDYYKCGINCSCGSASEIADAIMYLMKNEDIRTEMGKNSLTLGYERFDRQTSYKNIIKLLDSI